MQCDHSIRDLSMRHSCQSVFVYQPMQFLLSSALSSHPLIAFTCVELWTCIFIFLDHYRPFHQGCLYLRPTLSPCLSPVAVDHTVSATHSFILANDIDPLIIAWRVRYAAAAVRSPFQAGSRQVKASTSPLALLVCIIRTNLLNDYLITIASRKSLVSWALTLRVA
jgi:hypothetical protein